ncbi:hypothetical protein ACFGVR_02570 [Mucilaginibacter sp. AW1-3]
MYIRFITQFINENNETEYGIFNAIDYAIDHSLTQDEDVIKLKEIRKWFSTYLKKPDRFSNAKNKNPASVSLSWFKHSAEIDIGKMYEVKDILAKYDLTIEVVTIKNPGYIVYEDEHQVSAIPFKSDVKKVL